MAKATDEQCTVTLLAIQHDDIPAVLTALENGRTVRAKIAIGEQRATAAVLEKLSNEIQKLGARFTHEPANDLNPGDRWRRIEPPLGTGRDRAATHA